MAPLLLKRLWAWGPAILYLALITTVSHMRLTGVSLPSFHNADKVAHALEYGPLCFLLFRGLRLVRVRWLARWAPLLALLLCSAYGVIDEWHQSFVGRNCDPADWLADTIGAALVASVLMVYVEIRDRPADDREAY